MEAQQEEQTSRTQNEETVTVVVKTGKRGAVIKNQQMTCTYSHGLQWLHSNMEPAHEHATPVGTQPSKMAAGKATWRSLGRQAGTGWWERGSIGKYMGTKLVCWASSRTHKDKRHMSYSNMLTYGNHRRLVWHCLVFSSPWRHWQKKRTEPTAV